MILRGLMRRSSISCFAGAELKSSLRELGLDDGVSVPLRARPGNGLPGALSCAYVGRFRSQPAGPARVGQSIEHAARVRRRAGQWDRRGHSATIGVCFVAAPFACNSRLGLPPGI